MKIIILVLCVVTAILAETEEEKLHRIHKECQSNPATYADHKKLEHLKDYLNDPQVGAHMLCESQKLGLQTKKGALNIKVIKSKIALEVDDKKKVNCLAKECAVKKETAKKTAVNLFMCLDDHGITYFHEF